MRPFVGGCLRVGRRKLDLVMQRLRQIPGMVWQVLLMGLLGLAGVVFIPVILRLVGADLVADILVAQVYIYYLVLLVQFGFAWSGPAALARMQTDTGRARVWKASIQAKLLLLLGPVALMFVLGYVGLGWAQWYLWVFFILLTAYSLNSNWYLQARDDYVSGVLGTLFGVALSLFALWGLSLGLLQDSGLVGAVVLLALILPQVCLGVYSWWCAQRTCVGTVTAEPWREILAALFKDAPLVMSQLLLLAATTAGTIVVGYVANAETTAAYAATEKLFNLGATVLVGLYVAIYPKLALVYYEDRAAYWVRVGRFATMIFVGGFVLLGLLAWVGRSLLVLFLSEPFALLVEPVLLPFCFWLILCISQHLVTGYLVFAERHGQVLWVNGMVLFVTLVVGYVMARIDPVLWVYGMIAGQLLPIALLVRCYRLDTKAV